MDVQVSEVLGQTNSINFTNFRGSVTSKHSICISSNFASRSQEVATLGLRALRLGVLSEYIFNQLLILLIVNDQ